MEECKELTGNPFIWRARQLAAVVLTEQGRVGEARSRMQERIVDEMFKYYGNKLHN